MLNIFWSHDHLYNKNLSFVLKCVGDCMSRKYDVITFISSYISFSRRPGVATCTGTIKIAIILIKATHI